MKRPINYDNVLKMKPMRESLTLTDAINEAGRCLLCEDAPCSKGCPAGTDPARFIRQIRFANYKGAARTIRNNNILGLACSSTCPVEKLCEKECTSRKLGEPINISGLQGFACEYGMANKLEPAAKGKDGKAKVAVVGAGPSGIACAAELAKKGYDVTVFEKDDGLGGVVCWGIPAYRLAPCAIEYATSTLKDLGATVKFKTEVKGKDGVLKLLAQGYDAVFIGAGLAQSYGLDTFKGYKNVTSAAEFLRAARSHKTTDVKGKVVTVIGGGAVAMDAAVTAKTLGAKKVYAISLESTDELPANEEELELARKAGVIFRVSSKVKDVISGGETITGIKGTEIEWREKGNFSPANAVEVTGTEFILKTDIVIQAIGAGAASDIKELAATAREDCSTSTAGVFVGGDLLKGLATVAKAVGDGKRAAASIDKYITTDRSSSL